jgi:CDP-glucose 4,6-dehydratase
MEDLVLNSGFWKKKRVLLTGHTGFKGSWFSLWLQSLGADVIGYSLAPNTQPNLFEVAKVGDGMTNVFGDVRDLKHLNKTFAEYKPDIVIHMAAQSLVRYSYTNPVETYSTNVMGTVNLLEAVRHCKSVKAVVNVTSDKCYQNQERQSGYREEEPMGGYDPYSNSKGCAELVTSAYRNSYFNPDKYNEHGVALASARAGNVIGGGDWAEDRLIPDMIRAISQNEPVQIRNPNSIRPWQHVLEPLSGYLLLAQKLFEGEVEYAEAWNFGPSEEDAKPVMWIVERITKVWGDGASWRLDSGSHPHEAHYLKLNCTKANSRLMWQPRWMVSDAVDKICEWHKAHQSNADMNTICLDQVRQFVAA